MEERRAPDVLEMLVETLALRIKDKLMEEIMVTISGNLPTVHAEAVEGLEQYLDHAMDEWARNGGIKIDADDVEDLDEYIKDTLKQATISIDL